MGKIALGCQNVLFFCHATKAAFQPLTRRRPGVYWCIFYDVFWGPLSSTTHIITTPI